MTSASQADRKPNSFDGKHSFARAEQHSFVSIVTFLYYYRIVMTSNSSKKLHLWHKSLVSNKCGVVMITQHSVHPKTTEVGRGRGGNVCCVMFWWGQKEAGSGWGQKCLMLWWGQKKRGGGGGRSVCCVMFWWELDIFGGGWFGVSWSCIQIHNSQRVEIPNPERILLEISLEDGEWRILEQIVDSNLNLGSTRSRMKEESGRPVWVLSSLSRPWNRSLGLM